MVELHQRFQFKHEQIRARYYTNTGQQVTFWLPKGIYTVIGFTLDKDNPCLLVRGNKGEYLISKAWFERLNLKTIGELP